MEIKKGKQMFYIGESEKDNLAKVTYQLDRNGNYVLDHTYVSVELRGQKIAQKLVKQMVDFAREEGKKIIPVCSYAVSEFEKNNDYHDVLYKK
jgi:predicted GNAT family acetyltransferase